MQEETIDKILCYCEKFSNEYDYTELIEKIDQLKHIIPVPDNYKRHNFENWLEPLEDERIHWVIPNIEQLKWILCLLAEKTLCEQDTIEFYHIVCVLNDDRQSVSIDMSWFDNEIEFTKKLEQLYYKDIKEVLPTKNYVGNCSKEFCEIIVEKFWEREYERIQYIDFPPLEFHVPTYEKCLEEVRKLFDEPGVLSSKGTSNIIKMFHKSIIYANTIKSPSPYDGWKKIQHDKEAFKDFYRNRLRCSDWFKGEGRIIYLLRGVVMENTYGIGLSTSRKYQLVTYFKPRLAKYIVEKYLNEYETIFDPFSGYSGRMLGCVACSKNYIGQDLCSSSVEESNKIIEFLKKEGFAIHATVSCKNSLKEYCEADCLFTCPPYGNIENWPGVKSENYSSEKWIEICLTHYKCKRYVFVVDDNIHLEKYKKYIQEEIVNTSHLKANKEYIVVINESDLKDIVPIEIDCTHDGDSIETEYKGQFTGFGEYIYNVFNQRYFMKNIWAPSGFEEWIHLIYDKFNCERPQIINTTIDKVVLPEQHKKEIVLVCSGGLDSVYQIFQLKQMGYEKIVLYHLKNANFYENGQSYKSLNNLVKKLQNENEDIEFVVPVFHQNHNKPFSKYWAENPVKNQMIVLSLIDFCAKRGICNISIDGSWEFPIEKTTCGIDVTDAPENCDLLIESLKKYVKNLNYIRTEHVSKYEKLVFIQQKGLEDYIYSCLGPGKFNQYRHEIAQHKYGISLFKNNCGCSCRKCAHHNLLLYYNHKKDFPKEFIEKCWHTMSENGFPSRKMLFDKNIPLEQRIKNLYFE